MVYFHKSQLSRVQNTNIHAASVNPLCSPVLHQGLSSLLSDDMTGQQHYSLWMSHVMSKAHRWWTHHRSKQMYCTNTSQNFTKLMVSQTALIQPWKLSRSGVVSSWLGDCLGIPDSGSLSRLFSLPLPLTGHCSSPALSLVLPEELKESELNPESHSRRPSEIRMD